MRDKKIIIGMFGFGNVAGGLFELLQKIKPQNIEIRRVCVRNINKPRAFEADFTDNPDDIFLDDNINFIVELIDDAEASFNIVKRALLSRRPVVSGNKKMLARHIVELIELQKQTDTALLYDASACGSIPVIRNLEEYYDNDLLISVKGILNGSSNYILSKIFNEHMSYGDALTLAKEAGFVESNPTLDIDGWDSLFKLIIITVHAFGVYVEPERIFTYGISSMTDTDITFANEKDRRIKLVAHVEKVGNNRLVMCVMPQLISRNKYIYSVEDEFNGVVIKGLFYDKQFMFGRGAGGHPTGSAVLSDITACLYDYRYEYKKLHNIHPPVYTDRVDFRVYFRYHDADDLNLVDFKSIDERYESRDNKYVVGTVSLASLIRSREELHNRGVFVAAYPFD